MVKLNIACSCGDCNRNIDIETLDDTTYIYIKEAGKILAGTTVSTKEMISFLQEVNGGTK